MSYDKEFNLIYRTIDDVDFSFIRGYKQDLSNHTKFYINFLIYFLVY